jgi:hypothetical protein
MTWFKVDDGFAQSKPVLKIPRRYRLAATGLWAMAGSWSAREESDGFIPDFVLEELCGTPAVARHLVAAGLWQATEVPEGSSAVSGGPGWQFVNWAKYQPTRAQLEENREKERIRKQKQRESPRGPSSVPAGQTVGHHPESGDPVPTRPDPADKEEAKASSAAAKRGSRIPNDFAVAPAMVAWARANCPDVDGQRETMKFINYWQAKAGRDGVKLDWVATWRNWMMNAAERAPQGKPTTGDKMRTTIERAQAAQARLDQQDPNQLQIGA